MSEGARRFFATVRELTDDPAVLAAVDAMEARAARMEVPGVRCDDTPAADSTTDQASEEAS